LLDLLPEGHEEEFQDALRIALRSVQHEHPHAVWRALGTTGTLRALYRPGPRLEPDRRRLDLLLRELDASFRLGVVLSVCVQAVTVIPLLSEAASFSSEPDPAARVLEEMLGGETVVALAVTDAAGSGSDLMDAGTTAKLGDGSVALDGGKDWITNACGCDLALVLARHRDARHFTSFCWVLVPMAAPGVVAHPATHTAFAGAGAGHLRFDGVVLDDTHVAGRPGRAMAAFARQVGTERLAGALWSRAMCRRLLGDLHGWLLSRPAGGGRLWDNAAVRERFARCLLALAQLDAMCAPLLAADAGPVPPATGMLLKATAGETVERILAECVHLRGADAFRDGGEAELRLEAAMFSIAGGATGTMLAGIAEHAPDILTAGDPLVSGGGS
jgi:alkylation response protein AidB-like acyl-CoA dehydrogenase